MEGVGGSPPPPRNIFEILFPNLSVRTLEFPVYSETECLPKMDTLRLSVYKLEFPVSQFHENFDVVNLKGMEPINIISIYCFTF